MTLEELVNDTLGQYVNDEIMLDAFYQWSSNPTSMSAGYGLEDNNRYIKKNLIGRYGLLPAETDKRMSELKKACDSFISEAKHLPIKQREQIGEVQKTLHVVLSHGGYESLRRQGMTQRLREASEETKKALLLFNLLEEMHASVSPDNFTNPDNYHSNHQSEFQAYYKSLFGDMVPILKVAQEIIQTGVYNKLYRRYSPDAVSSPRSELVKAILPSDAELEVLGIRGPQLPDVPFLLESYWQKGDFDILRFVDIISHSTNGVFTTDEPLPDGADNPGFMGSYGRTIALSPNILMKAKQHIESMKDQKIEPVRQRLESALSVIRRQMTPDEGSSVLWTSQGEKGWRFSTIPPLYVYLAPWLTTSSLADLSSHVNFKDKPHVLFVIPYQTRASFLTALDSHSKFSSKDKRWEKSLGLLTNLEEPSKFQLLLGERHPLLNKIFGEIAQSGRTSERIMPPEVSLVKPHAKKQEISEPREFEPTPVPFEITFPPYDDGKKLVFGRGFLKDKIAWGFEIDKPFSTETLVTSDLHDINQPHVGSFQQTRTGKSTLASCVVLQAAFQGVPVVVIDPKPDYVSSLIPVTKTVSSYPDHKGPIEKRFAEAKQDIRGFDFTSRVEFEHEDRKGNKRKRNIRFQLYSFDKDLRDLPNCCVLKLPMLVLPPADDVDFDDQCNAAATSLVNCLPLRRGKAINTLLANIMKKFKKENLSLEFMLKEDIEHELELCSMGADKEDAKRIRTFKDALDDYYTQNSYLFASTEAEIVKMDTMVQNPDFEDGDKQTVTISVIDVSALPQEKNNPVMLNYVSQVCGQLYSFVKRKRSDKPIQLFIVFDEAQNYLPDPSDQYNYARVVINRGASLGIKAWLMAQSPQAVEKEARKQFTVLVLSKVNEASVRDEVSKYVQSDSWTDKLKQTELGKALIVSSGTGKEGGKLCVVFTTPQTVNILSPKQIVKALRND